MNRTVRKARQEGLERFHRTYVAFGDPGRSRMSDPSRIKADMLQRSEAEINVSRACRVRLADDMIDIHCVDFTLLRTFAGKVHVVPRVDNYYWKSMVFMAALAKLMKSHWF